MITDDLDSRSSSHTAAAAAAFFQKPSSGEVMIVGCPLPFPLSGFSVTPRKYY